MKQFSSFDTIHMELNKILSIFTIHCKMNVIPQRNFQISIFIILWGDIKREKLLDNMTVVALCFNWIVELLRSLFSLVLSWRCQEVFFCYVYCLPLYNFLLSLHSASEKEWRWQKGKLYTEKIHLKINRNVKLTS